MSLDLMKQVWKDPHVTGAARIVLLSLADQANKDSLCWPGFASISRRCNINRRTTVKAIKWLEKHGYLVITRRPEPGNKHQSNLYRVIVPQNGGPESPVADGHQDNEDGCAAQPGMVVQGNHNTDSGTGRIMTQSHPDTVIESGDTGTTSPRMVAHDHPGSGEKPPESLMNPNINLQRTPIEPFTPTTALNETDENF